MKSPLPKVLHKIGGRTMLDRAIDAAYEVGCEKVIVVVGNHSPAVRETATKRVGADNIVIKTRHRARLTPLMWRERLWPGSMAR